MYHHVDLIDYGLLALFLVLAIRGVSMGFSWGTKADKCMAATFFMMIVMAILGGLTYGIKGGLRATVATFFVGWMVTAIVEKLEKGQATKRKKLEHERRHPYVASPEELPRVLE